MYKHEYITLALKKAALATGDFGRPIQTKEGTETESADAIADPQPPLPIAAPSKAGVRE